MKEVGFDVWRKVLRWGVRHSLTCFVLNPTSCCTSHIVELKSIPYQGVGSLIAHQPEAANVLVLCGPVTYKMGPIIRHFYDQMSKPSWVVAMGSCACGGGAMGASYAVCQDPENILPVDAFVPGCPTSFSGLLKALDLIAEKGLHCE